MVELQGLLGGKKKISSVFLAKGAQYEIGQFRAMTAKCFRALHARARTEYEAMGRALGDLPITGTKALVSFFSLDLALNTAMRWSARELLLRVESTLEDVAAIRMQRSFRRHAAYVAFRDVQTREWVKVSCRAGECCAVECCAVECCAVERRAVECRAVDCNADRPLTPPPPPPHEKQFFNRVDERLHGKDKACGFFPLNEFHVLVEMSHHGVVNDGLVMTMFNEWHHRADHLLEREHAHQNEVMRRNVAALCIQRSYRRLAELKSAHSSGLINSQALQAFAARATRVRSIEKTFLFFMSAHGHRDQELAIQAESARGPVSAKAFAWLMHRFGFNCSFAPRMVEETKKAGDPGPPGSVASLVALGSGGTGAVMMGV